MQYGDAVYGDAVYGGCSMLAMRGDIRASMRQNGGRSDDVLVM
jgi:hypothetical protein